jgi:glycosyltransferase involved in cell wall biosynthesis
MNILTKIDVRSIPTEDRVPAVSVLLPVYNAERYLREAIESVLCQTFGDFELLMLDDGSTDDSAAILWEYELKDRRVHVFSRENRGLPSTLNELIGKARGRYLARMDQDDICLPNRFENQVAFLSANTEHVLVGGWIEQINEAGQPIGIVRTPCAHDDIDRFNLRGRCSVWHPTAMMTKKAVLAIAAYDIELEAAEDLDLWLRLAEVGKIANLEHTVLRYRLHDNSLSATQREKQMKNAELACIKAWRRRKISGQFDATKHWRAGKDKISRHKFALHYGWIAWNNNHRDTWWTYVCKAFGARPLALSTWKLLIFGLLRRPNSTTGKT